MPSQQHYPSDDEFEYDDLDSTALAELAAIEEAFHVSTTSDHHTIFRQPSKVSPSSSSSASAVPGRVLSPRPQAPYPVSPPRKPTNASRLQIIQAQLDLAHGGAVDHAVPQSISEVNAVDVIRDSRNEPPTSITGPSQTYYDNEPWFDITPSFLELVDVTAKEQLEHGVSPRSSGDKHLRRSPSPSSIQLVIIYIYALDYF